MPVVDKKDVMGNLTHDSKTEVKVKPKTPFPGELPAPDDLFILRASFHG